VRGQRGIADRRLPPEARAIAEFPACQNDQEAGAGKSDKTDAQPKILPKAAKIEDSAKNRANVGKHPG
jgi:hypothetical protein